MHTLALFSTVIALLLVCSHAVPIRDVDSFATLERRGWDAGVVEARGGIAASQARLLELTARKSDLELQQQFVGQSRKQLADMVSSLLQQSSKLDPASDAAKKIQSQVASIQSKDKELEMQSKKLDTELQAVETEIEAVKKVIDPNIEESFQT